ncbi:glycoside hydrolase family 3 C-terminal domain-containing protein [Aerococcaceae bacterium DSM 111176]|nr:glycoside hydrolase family 3 C-terminal domain-containing protein [Aerococcaceae bacterium DSM 111176]
MNQPHLETRHKEIIEVDGLKFKDLNGNGKLDAYEDWRLSPEERAKDLVAQMTKEEKAGMMLNYQLLPGHTTNEEGETGILNEKFEKADGSISKRTDRFPTTETIERLKLRHFIFRENMPAKETAEWVNAVQEVAEKTRLGIPGLFLSNSRNENSEATLEGDKSEGAYTLFPGTLGVAAAVMGTGDYTIADKMAESVRHDFKNVGVRKGYFYMADVTTDPRWQRTFGTFGEDPEVIGEIISRLIKGIQGPEITSDSVTMTVKHFPGGGARENGFDPHYKEGKWNVYRTPGALEDYHLKPFERAIAEQPASIMPYYSAPSIDKSSFQEYKGEIIPFEEVGMTFNHYILNDLLRDQMGFEGYVNSDTGVTDSTPWGVEDKNEPARHAKAINAGTDLIAAHNEPQKIVEAIDKGWISMNRIDAANVRLLKEMFALGVFDSETYVDPEAAAKAVEDSGEMKAYAHEVHQKSVTVLKNKNVLPLSEDKKVYIAGFHKDAEKGAKYGENTVKAAKDAGFNVVEDYKEADAVIFMMYPVTGDYFNATPGFLELTLCEEKINIALNGDTYKETTLSEQVKRDEIVRYAQANDIPVVSVVNVTIPWILDNVEPYSDGLVAIYETDPTATLEVLFGRAKAEGVLPITLPKNEQVIAVDEHGVCVTRNDVPGYDKDKYLRPGMTYGYEDSEGNKYYKGFGLTY